MSFEILFQFFINGLVLSFIYSLVAIGFTLYFGVIDIIKFSHGDFLMLSSFLFLALINFLFKDNGSIYYLSSLILTFSAMAIIGFLIAKPDGPRKQTVSVTGRPLKPEGLRTQTVSVTRRPKG